MHLPFYKTLESQENRVYQAQWFPLFFRTMFLRVPKVQAENSLLLPKHTVTVCIHK